MGLQNLLDSKVYTLGSLLTNISTIIKAGDEEIAIMLAWSHAGLGNYCPRLDLKLSPCKKNGLKQTGGHWGCILVWQSQHDQVSIRANLAKEWNLTIFRMWGAFWKYATSSKGQQVDSNAKLTKQLINEFLELPHTIPIFDPQHSYWYIAKYD